MRIGTAGIVLQPIQPSGCGRPRCYLPFIATPKAGPKAQRQVVMSGCYLFFRFCPNLNSTFPAEELDEVRDED
jgi:hypothetical protein